MWGAPVLVTKIHINKPETMERNTLRIIQNTTFMETPNLQLYKQNQEKALFEVIENQTRNFFLHKIRLDPFTQAIRAINRKNVNFTAWLQIPLTSNDSYISARWSGKANWVVLTDHQKAEPRVRGTCKNGRREENRNQ